MRMGPLRQDRRKIGVGSKERSRFPGRPHLSFMQRQRRAHQHAAAPEKLEKLESKVRRDSGRGGRGKGAVSIEDSSPAAASQKRCMLCFGRVRVSLDRRRVERALDELHGDLGRRRDSEQQHRGRQPRPRPWRSASAGRMSRRGSACPPEPRPRAARTSRPATGGRSVPPRNAAGGNDRDSNRLDAGATHRPRAPTQCLGSVRQPPPGAAKRRGGPSW